MEPDVSLAKDAGEDQRGGADEQGRFRVRSSAEVFYRGLGGEATDKLPRVLPAINCSAGDVAANDAGRVCGAATAKDAKNRKTGCVGCTIM